MSHQCRAKNKPVRDHSLNPHRGDHAPFRCYYAAVLTNRVTSLARPPLSVRLSIS